MLDHLVLKVTDYEKSSRFYKEALAPLGYEVIMELEAGVGFGMQGKPYFWVTGGERHPSGLHIAFASPNRKLVDAFHAAALKAGGRDNGPPGIRAHYHPDYYGAFVFDPDGNNIEAVCHKPEA